MVKRQLAHLKKARLASVEHFKKRKLEQTPYSSEQLRIDHNQDDNQLRIDDNQLDTSDTDGTSDKEGENTWFWHESANESESDTEDEGYSDEEESDLGPRRARTEEEAAPQKTHKEIKWNRRGEDNLRGFYGNGSRATLKRKRNVAKMLEKEASKCYNIGALWQRNRDLSLISQVNAQSELEKNTEPGIDEDARPLSQVLLGGSTSSLNQQSFTESRIVALQDITRLLELVTEQEKKYEDRLSPHSNFYRRHVMVQQFLQIQLKTKPSPTRRQLSLNIARFFGRGHATGQNIVQWENMWVEKREIPKRKSRNDYFSWMDNEEITESI